MSFVSGRYCYKTQEHLACEALCSFVRIQLVHISAAFPRGYGSSYVARVSSRGVLPLQKDRAMPTDAVIRVLQASCREHCHMRA